MKKYIEIPEEILGRLDAGERLEGSIRKDLTTGKIEITFWNRRYVRPRENTICHLEHGWLKETSTKIKFFNSVPKEVGAVMISKAMNRELEFAMDELFLQNIIQ